MSNTDYDPIVARATAAGRGGIGIIRVSGSTQALSVICEALFPGKVLKPRTAFLLPVRSAAGDLIDQVVVLKFQGPHSYTGEDVLEIQAHGGPAVLQMIQSRVLEVGAAVELRLAEPGEFSKRAFLNGRMDLTQAEAVADLIDAGSASAARAAARSLQGVFSQKVYEIAEHLTNLRAYVEATLDFPEEDIDFINDGRVARQVDDILKELTDLEKRALYGKVLRDGLTVVMAGAPNVGKSSLMNALAQNEVAIVTDIAGTTRDRIEHDIDLDGLLIHLIDTAGVRETDDPVEKIGVERTLQAVETADVVLTLVDGTDKTAVSDTAQTWIRNRLREGVTEVLVMNKIDLGVDQGKIPDGAVCISAKTGEGIDALLEKLKKISVNGIDFEGNFSARTRHLTAIAKAKSHLIQVQESLQSMTLELVAEELRLALNELGTITGQILPDDLLGIIFSKFCIGK